MLSMKGCVPFYGIEPLAYKIGEFLLAFVEVSVNSSQGTTEVFPPLRHIHRFAVYGDEPTRKTVLRV